MAKGFKQGTAGNALDFRVIAYATQADLLADSPKDKTVGVITTTAITGWILSREEPETAAEGTVWILLTEKSVASFDLLKRNSVPIHPFMVRQRKNGIWLDVPAMSRKYGVWMPWWDGYLYHQGNTCDLVTEGWKAYAYVPYDSGSSAYAPTLTLQTDTMKVVLSKPTSGYRGGAVFTEKAVDVSAYRKLKIRVWSLSELTAGTVNIGLASTKENGYTQIAAAEITRMGDVTLDLTNITGEYYVCLRIGGVSSAGSTVTMEVDSIWLE